MGLYFIVFPSSTRYTPIHESAEVAPNDVFEYIFVEPLSTSQVTTVSLLAEYVDVFIKITMYLGVKSSVFIVVNVFGLSCAAVALAVS